MNTATPSSSTPDSSGSAGNASAGGGPGSSTPAAASTPTSEPAPGRGATESDRELLQFALTIELAARDLFRLAVADQQAAGGEESAPSTTPASSTPPAVEPPDILAVAADNHDQYADVLGGLLGESQAGTRDQGVYGRWQSDFSSGDETTIGQAAYDLESAIVATYEEMIGQLEGLDGIERIASMITVEAAQSTVFADVAGHGDDLAMMLENTAQPLSSAGNREATS